MDWNTLGSSVLHYLPELAQIHVHWVGDAIQPSHPLLLLLLLPSVFPSIQVFAMGLASFKEESPDLTSCLFSFTFSRVSYCFIVAIIQYADFYAEAKAPIL